MPILLELSLTSVLALSSTCRSLRNLITNPLFLDRVLRDAIAHGSLRWICPVDTVPRGETRRARRAFVEWANIVKGKLDIDEDDSSDDDKPLAVRMRELKGTTGDLRNEDANQSEDDNDDNDDHEGDGSEDESRDEDDSASGEDPKSILTSPDFPRLAFVRACWKSDSMMNRKRLWGQVRRFGVLWKDYRMNGWQDPCFYPAHERRDDKNE